MNVAASFRLSLFILSIGACQQSDSGPTALENYRAALAAAETEYAGRQELIQGLYFGMSQDSFFQHCRAAQQRGDMRDGLDNMVRFDAPASTVPGQGVVEFYPAFNNAGRLAALPGRVYAKAWAPWNPQYGADSMLLPTQRYFEQVLGGRSFVHLDHDGSTVFVKVDSARRVAVWPDPDKHDRVLFEMVDLRTAPDSVRQGFDLLALLSSKSIIR